MSRTGSATEHGGDATRQSMINLLRTNKVDMTINSTCRDDASLPRNHLCGGTNGHTNAILQQRISRMADANDATALDANVRFDDPLHAINDEGVRNHKVQRIRVQCQGRLRHTITNDFASAKFHLVAIPSIFGNQIALHFHEKLRIREPHLIANSWTKHAGVLFAGNLHAGSTPLTRLFNPWTSRIPANATTPTSRVSPGSKRTAVPAGMFSRNPNAVARSKCSEVLTS